MPTRALRTAASGMYAQQLNIQVIANNIANINTTSFKKSRAEFSDQIYQEVSTNTENVNIPGIIENVATKLQIGNGVQPTSTQKLFQQGDLQQTGHQLDVAISGEGFFQIRKPDGTFAYTRDGSFKISGDGSLATAGGYLIEPGISINDDVLQVQISDDGTVRVTDVTGDAVEVGTIELAKFINPAGLKALGDNLYAETEASGAPLLGRPNQEGFGILKQGFLESSNVDIVEEMISMITAQRAYEINSKTVKTVEEMMTMVNNLRR
ncbi:MAG: flagellar basal-body rod protein FlgG [Melioribacteraceae bacterium]|jgi:flagellar basal-body rod protein FlgG|nr:flagellar basal-body rod protein FlgG [Melioribacteraceae bacterium]